MLSIFKRKKKQNKSNSNRYFRLKIKAVKKETDDANTIIFENPESPFHYKPGQFLTLVLPIKGEEVRRSYSLCSSPFIDESPAITVKRVESGIVSNYINDHMKVGDNFEVMEAAGHFVPSLEKEQKKDYILFAAGSGITPLMSIIKSILEIEQESNITLVYQNRNEQSIIFKEDLNKIASDYQGRFKHINVLSQPTESWEGYTGRIDSAMANIILMGEDGSNLGTADYYLCGPTGFMQTVLETLIEFEVPENHIYKESFYTGEPKHKINSKAKSSDAAYDVKIMLDGAEYSVTVPSNKTILEAALDQDIDMPFSCQSGLCTACRGKLLQGHVDMEDDEGLSEEEIKEGYILNCVSKPTGPGVKIEIC